MTDPARPDQADPPTPRQTGVEVLAHGHLTTRAEVRTDRYGKQYTVARLAVPDRQGAPVLRLITHVADVGDTLARMVPGDPLSVAGVLMLYHADDGPPIGINARRIVSTIRHNSRKAA